MVLERKDSAVQSWNNYERFSNLSELWKLQLISFTSNLAFKFENQTFTYKELDEKSDILASKLLTLGVMAGDVVAIFNSKNINSYAAMIACLKFGFVYTNLDSATPIMRLNKILHTCNPKVILHDQLLTEDSDKNLKKNGFTTLLIDNSFIYIDNLEDLPNQANITWHTPAYIMFTSGSTGFPKGVTITHGGLISFISWSIKYYDVKVSDRFAQLSPMYFDNSVFDFYTALFAGASLVPISQEKLKDPFTLINYVSDSRCTIWFSVPSLLIYLSTMRVFTKNIFQQIRVITFGGEGFPKGELKKLYDLFENRIKFINVYGPTEGTCICSSYEISNADFEDMKTLCPLGKINPNFDYIILDNEMHRVKEGEKGELCLIGPNISPGYYNDTERTNQQFIQHPEINSYTEKIYRTGDLVYEKEKTLWFVGRIDNQIKHMGYRIELEEIEAAINSIDSVQQCGVIYIRENERHGRILAYIQTLDNKTKEDIISKLNNYLPKYMIPNDIIFLNQLPKNQNGKVDRIKLKENFEYLKKEEI